MIQRILAPLDGSALAECVLPHLVTLVKANEAELHLLRVLDPTNAATRPRVVDPFDWQIRKAEAETYLRETGARLEKAGVTAQTEVLEGKAADAAIEYAGDHQIDLIILSSHGQSGISGWNVSSVVQKIIGRAQTSVMVVRAYQTSREDLSGLTYARILAPLDGSQRAEIVLPVAAKLARYSDGELLLAHVIQPPEMPRNTPLTDDEKSLSQQVVDRNRAEADRYLNDLKNRLDVKLETRLLVSDSVGSALHGIADQDQVDLVIMSAHGYTGEAKWPYGSTVISFITYGSTPLLVIQDLARDQIEPTRAEIAARQHGGR